jgi:hypothetical protein
MLNPCNGAAGDDVFNQVDARDADRIAAIILNLTSRDALTPNIGLGQVVKSIRVGAFYEMDFCSKWSFCPTGALKDWKLTRDVSKLLSTKNYYTGNNKHILENGYLHRQAILQGL